QPIQCLCYFRMIKSHMLVYIFPIISALIGWFTNFLAVKMLFRPRKPVNIGFYKVQGIFPKRQKKLAERIGKMVADELLSTEDIKAKLDTPETKQVLLNKVGEKFDDYLSNKLAEKYPIISTFLTDGMKQKIRDEFTAELGAIIPTLISDFVGSLDQVFDVEETIRTKVEELSIEKLEGLIMGILKKEFVFIELVGAVIGFLVGCLMLLLQDQQC
ncbi:MAG: DUF445 family protein, partial [Flavobacteriales bacterium]|nr:DUF445 family protein [Flavobacteriales bacterium]